MKTEEAAERLMNTNQGRKSVAEFAILFRSIATSTGWLDEPLMVIFNHALSEPVRYALSLVEAPTSLDALVERAIWVVSRVHKQGGDRLANKNGQPRLKASHNETNLAPAPDTDVGFVPMQVDGTDVRKPQKGRPFSFFCMHCKKKGHSKTHCWLLNDQSH